MINLALGIVLILFASLVVKEMIKILNNSGRKEIAKPLAELDNKINMVKKELLDSGKKILAEKIDCIKPENIEKILSDELESVLLTILPSYQKKSLSFLPNKNTTYVITEDKAHPFQITPLISETAERVTKSAKGEREKAQAIFDWFEKNIKYDDDFIKHKNREKEKNYYHSIEVFEKKLGVCGEMAILYVVMARSVGLISNYTSVRKDKYGEKVHHACAAVVVNGKKILVDPAYSSFDIKHGQFEILDDETAIRNFKIFRQGG